MSSVIERNLRCLQKFQPEIFNKVNSYKSGNYINKNNSVERILLARQDDLIINMLVVCNGMEYLMCNHEDPINQAYEWIDKYIDPASKTYIVFGMGFAYHLEVLLGSFQDKKVIIIEPDIDLFYNLLTVRNLEMIIENSEIFLDEQPAEIVHSLMSIFAESSEGGAQLQPFEVYSDMFRTQWEELRDRFIKRVESFAVDIATRRHFGEMFIHNNVTNAGKLHEAANAGALAGKFKNVPAILVSAGPSLDKSLPLLKNLTDKCILMAAGTAVNILEDNGITPHFMMGIDASDSEAKIHEKAVSKEIFFIYSNQVATGSVDGYGGPKFLMNYSADEFTSGFFRYAQIDSAMHFSGPSVANTCFDALYKMGCNPIILVGQDMAFTDNREYSGNAKRRDVQEEIKKDASGLVKVKDKKGNDVYTLHSYLSMRNWFEGYFEKVSGKIDIINATEGGLDIKFSRNESLESVVQRYEFHNVNVSETILDIYNNNRFDTDTIARLEEYKEMLYKDLISLEEHSQKQLKLVDLIKRDVYHPSKSKNAFSRIANQVSEFTNKVVNSQAYKILLKNITGMDFFLIKREVDIATRSFGNYKEVKDFYIKAMLQQNQILKEKIDKVKKLLKT